LSATYEKFKAKSLARTVAEKKNADHARAVMSKKTYRNERTYVHRLGFSNATSTYSNDCSIDQMSGSSLNRRYALNRKKERERVYEAKKEAAEKFGGYFDEYGNWCSPNELYRPDKVIKPRDSRKLAFSLDGRAVTIHVLSKRSKSKIQDKFKAFHSACSWGKSFCTLTFIQSVSDRTGQTVLNKFLNQLRKKYPGFKYMWVAERQTKNVEYPNNIHFHCIFSREIPVKQFNALWVLQQYNEGLSNYKYSKQEVEQRYKEGTIGKILNPLHIDKIKNSYTLGYYITKYVTKNKSEGFECLAWHCSRHVSRLFTKKVVGRSCINYLRSPINSRTNPKTGIKTVANHPPPGKFWQVFNIENVNYFLKELSELIQVNKWILNDDYIPPDRQTDDDDIRRFIN
jgi:hypothetical protein